MSVVVEASTAAASFASVFVTLTPLFPRLTSGVPVGDLEILSSCLIFVRGSTAPFENPEKGSNLVLGISFLKST